MNYDHCPNRVDISTLGEEPGSRFLCGCGRCPVPDQARWDIRHQLLPTGDIPQRAYPTGVTPAEVLAELEA